MAVIGREPARWDDAVNVRMEKQVLSPGMQNADDADLRAQMFGIGRDFQQCLRAGSEQQVVEHGRIVQGQYIEFVWRGEHDMEVGGGEKLAFAGSKPALARLRLALRAVPVAARVVGDGLAAALRTGSDVAAQRGRAAALNRRKGFALLKVAAPVLPVQKVAALYAEDVGHLHGGSAHFGLLR